MSGDRETLATALSRALSGEGAHVEHRHLFAGLDWKAAGSRPNGVPYSVFELLNHMAYWQDWVVRWLDGRQPPIPAHASGSWPGDQSPASADEWEQAVRSFLSGLEKLSRRGDEADLTAGEGQKSPHEMLHTIAAHNSYHAGQVALVRQMLGSWPPPAGGLTW